MPDLSVVRSSRMLRARAAADHLNVSVSTIYREAAAGRLPAVRVRTVLLFPEWALDRWVESQIPTGSWPPVGSAGGPTPPAPAEVASSGFRAPDPEGAA